MDNYSAAGFLDRGDYSLFIERPDRAQIDDLNAGALLFLRLFRRLHGDGYHRAISKKAHIRSLLHRLCLAERNGIIFFRRLQAE